MNAQQQAQKQRQAQIVAALGGLQALPEVLAGVGRATELLASQSKPQLVDTRGLGRPDSFKNEEARFQTFSQKAEGFIESIFEGR